MKRRSSWLLLGLALGLPVLTSSLAPRPSAAQPMMMDPAKMSGIPRPDPAVPAGTITVRLIRGSLSNRLTDVAVDLVDQAAKPGEAPRRAKTDAEGRATFSALPRATYEARAVVDGEALATQPIPLPESPGVRVMLVFQKSVAEQQKELGTPDGAARVDEALPPGTLVVKVADEAGKPLADLPVAVHHGDRSTEKVEQVGEKKTDAQGVARWDGLKVGDGDGYMVGVTRGAALIRSKPFRLVGEHGSTLAMTAHAVVRDVSQVVLGNGSHIILEVTDDSVQVMENLVLKNPLEQSVDPGPGGLRIPLAERALSAQLLNAAEEQNPRLSVDVSQPDQPPAVVWRGPIPPGSHPVRAAFLLKQNGEVHFRQQLAQNSESLLVAIAKLPTISVKGAEMESQDRKIEGKEWIFLRPQEGKLATAGAFLDFQASGFPYDGPIYRALAGSVALVIALALAALAWRGPRTSSASTRKQRRVVLNQQREELLAELQRLDANRQTSRREALLVELEQVYQELDRLHAG